MLRLATLLALPLVASAFVPATTTTAPRTAARGRTLSMNFGYERGGRPVGGVQWFPDSENYWDPLGFYKDADPKWQWRLANGEIKNGRVAMLACLDYLVRGLGFHFPFDIGGVKTAELPDGLATAGAVPFFGFWLPFFFLCGALEVATDSAPGSVWPGGNPGQAKWMLGHLPDRVPGNVQPLTEAFEAPGDEEIRTKEINNGRMAMIAIFGIWAGEIVNHGEQPLQTWFRYLGY